MKLGEQLFLAGKSYGQAIRLIDKYKLWSLLILPAILSLIIAIIVGGLAWMTSRDVLAFIINKYSFNSFDVKMGRVLEFTISIIIRLVILFFYLKIFRYLILIFLSPVFVNISNVLQSAVHRDNQKADIWSYCYCSFRGVKMAIRNFIYEILLTFALIFISLVIFWILPLIPILFLIIESYFIGMTLMDYKFKQNDIGQKEGINITRKHSGLAITNGLVFNLIILVPIIGVIVGPVWAFVASWEATDHIKYLDVNGNTINKSV